MAMPVPGCPWRQHTLRIGRVTRGVAERVQPARRDLAVCNRQPAAL